MANNSKLSKRGGKRIVPKDMPHEHRKEYRELMRDEYITFRQEIQNSIEKRKEVSYQIGGYEFEHNISAFVTVLKQQDDIFQEWVKNGDMNITLHKCFDELTWREEIIIKRRFGFGGLEPLLLEEVGRDMHITRERVRQIEVKALRKIKRIMKVLIPKEYWPTKFGYNNDEEYDDE
jgi:RNA polymerase sigma factor (sigma-70 family)